MLCRHPASAVLAPRAGSGDQHAEAASISPQVCGSGTGVRAAAAGATAMKPGRAKFSPLNAVPVTVNAVSAPRRRGVVLEARDDRRVESSRLAQREHELIAPVGSSRVDAKDRHTGHRVDGADTALRRIERELAAGVGAAEIADHAVGT